MTHAQASTTPPIHAIHTPITADELTNEARDPKADTHADARDDSSDQTPDSDLRSRVLALVETGRDIIRERPLTALGSAAALGFIAGSLTPRLIAQPVGALALKALLSRLTSSSD